MKFFGLVIGSVFAIILVTVGLGWLLTGNDLNMYRYFAPKYEAARRDVYQQTPSFLNGNRQNLLNQVAAIKATQDPVARQQLKSGLQVMVNGLPEGFEVPLAVKQVLSEP